MVDSPTQQPKYAFPPPKKKHALSSFTCPLYKLYTCKLNHYHTICDKKMRCYEEPFREHIGNKQKTTTSPGKPKRNKLRPTEPSHWLHEVCISEAVHYHFQPEHNQISISLLGRRISQHCHTSCKGKFKDQNLCCDAKSLHKILLMKNIQIASWNIKNQVVKLCKAEKGVQKNK